MHMASLEKSPSKKQGFSVLSKMKKKIWIFDQLHYLILETWQVGTLPTEVYRITQCLPRSTLYWMRGSLPRTTFVTASRHRKLLSHRPSMPLISSPLPLRPAVRAEARPQEQTSRQIRHRGHVQVLVGAAAAAAIVHRHSIMSVCLPWDWTSFSFLFIWKYFLWEAWMSSWWRRGTTRCGAAARSSTPPAKSALVLFVLIFLLCWLLIVNM